MNTLFISNQRYTGQDLLSPSCWSRSNWAPTVSIITNLSDRIDWFTLSRTNHLPAPSLWKDGLTDQNVSSFSNVCGILDVSNREVFLCLTVCSNKNKCIFVRVIDTCAGCAQGSRHVDLTKAAFKALADLSVGVTTVKMRRATHPKEWWVVWCIHELRSQIRSGALTCGDRNTFRQKANMIL